LTSTLSDRKEFYVFYSDVSGWRTFRLMLATCVVAGLSACSSGGEGDALVSEAPDTASEFRAMEAWYEAQSRQNNRALQAGDGSMPVSGVATYEGVARHYHRPDPSGGREGAETMMSAFGMVADFGSGDVEGYMSDFRREDGGPVEGMIHILGRQTTGDEMKADLEGTMSINGSNRVIDGTLDARFAGSNADGLQGTHRSTSNDGTLWGHVSAVRTDQ
jgi:hypothetical protein